MPHRIVVYDTESADGTNELISGFAGVELFTIPRDDFNHGATRELARKHLNTDIVVLLSQDVVPRPGWLARLVGPLVEGKAEVSFARQLPHEGADILEAFPREFNYPGHSHRRTIQDANKQGVYTFFCSDSCSAYLNSALYEIGGFEPTLTNEDYFAVAKILQRGGAIAYVAEAEVYHSHRYTLIDELKRCFDTGYVRAENPWVTDLVGHAEKRGLSMSAGLLRRVAMSDPAKLPYAFAHLSVKSIGYRLGFLGYRFLSREWCRRLSSQPYYWNSRHCRHPRA